MNMWLFKLHSYAFLLFRETKCGNNFPVQSLNMSYYLIIFIIDESNLKEKHTHTH